MRTILTLLTITILLLTSCDLFNSNINEEQEDKITFESLIQNFQTDSEVDGIETAIIENQDQAVNFLNTYLSDTPEEHRLFDVNYTDSLVLGVFVGSRPNNSYSIEIDSLIATDNSNQAYVTESGSAGGGRVIVWPAHFITINKTDFGDREVSFNFTQVCELDPCSWQN